MQGEKSSKGFYHGRFVRIIKTDRLEFGFCKEGNMEGYGITLYENGDTYEGMFKYGNPHGYGVKNYNED